MASNFIIVNYLVPLHKPCYTINHSKCVLLEIPIDYGWILAMLEQDYLEEPMLIDDQNHKNWEDNHNQSCFDQKEGKKILCVAALIFYVHGLHAADPRWHASCRIHPRQLEDHLQRAAWPLSKHKHAQVAPRNQSPPCWKTEPKDLAFKYSLLH